jgi:hypothetical protein
MAHRNIEILIGRLITDEGFRTAFARDARRTLAAFTASGHELTDVELDAVMAIGCELWNQVAGRMDPRLLKAALL